MSERGLAVGEGLASARERWVRTGGVELCVAELGDPQKPTVVLVHGYPDSKEVWSEVAPAWPAASTSSCTTSEDTAGRRHRSHCAAGSSWRS